MPKKKLPAKPEFKSLEESNAWLGIYTSMICGALAGQDGAYVDAETSEIDATALARQADRAYDEFLSRVPDDEEEEEEETTEE